MSDARPRRALLVGPLPPPVGGIATIVANLAADPATADRFDFLDVTKRGTGFIRLQIVRPVRQLLELAKRLRNGSTALFAFSSAYGSFWEKCLWLLLARRRKVPMLVMMVDGRFGDFFDAQPKWRQRLIQKALAKFHTVIVQTEFWRRYYSGIAPGGNYAVLPNGVDCREFAPAPREPSDRVVVLLVGWLVPEKGVFDLIEAAREIDGAGKRFVLRLVGPYHGNESALRAKIAEHGLEEAVQLVGPVTVRSAILEEYQRADIFTLPSWAEGLPVSVLEAMGCALPIVATSVGGVPDLVNEQCGVLVPPRDPRQLASALCRFIDDAQLRRACGAAARERVQREFSTDNFGPGVLRLIHEATR